MRRRATVGCARPARQRLHAETIESTVQWMKKTMTKAWNARVAVSPGCGIVGSANVQTTRIALSEKSAFASAGPAAEGGREAEEEVRKEDEERDDDPAEGALGEVAGVVRDQAEEVEQAERAERDRRPHGRPVAPAPPEEERDNPSATYATRLT